MLYFILTHAFASESTPQIFLMQEEIPLLEDVERDTGWLPPSGNLSVRFQVVANGGVSVRQEGGAELHWGDSGRVGISLMPQEDPYAPDQIKLGLAELNSELAVVLSLKFSILQFEWEQDFTLETIAFGDSEEFIPFLLDDQLHMSGSAGEQHFFQTDLSPIPGTDLFFRVEIEPLADLVLEGVHWELESHSDPNQFVESSDESAGFTPYGSDYHEAIGHYVLNADLDLDLLFSPVFEVCVPLAGCFEWEVVELPATAFKEQVEHHFAPQEWAFPMPLSAVFVGDEEVVAADLETDVSAEIIFEPIQVGDLMMFELPVHNDGALPLNLIAEIDDEQVFSAFPQDLTVAPYSSSGLVVYYLAETEEAQQSALTLKSNDPTAPIRNVSLKASAVQSSYTGEGEQDEFDGTEKSLAEGEAAMISRGCSCSTSSARGLERGIWLLTLVPLFIFRRYRV